MVLFGDTVTARVGVAIDRTRVDPASLRIATNFAPWSPVGAPRSTRRDGETTSYLETTYVLRCLALACVPRRTAATREFEPVGISYTRRGGGQGSLSERWPVLVTNSRIVVDDLDRDDELGEPWRADVVSVPAASYRSSPSLILFLLLAGAGVLAIAGAALAYRALPRRRTPLPAPVVPERELTPLERALALLDDHLPGDERRRTLERVAQLLEEQNGELAGAARTLAWSNGLPAPEETGEFADRVRSAVVDGSADAPHA